MGIKDKVASSGTSKSPNMDGIKRDRSLQSAYPSSQVGPGKEGGKPRILVIDNEEMILSLLSRILTLEGYHVTCASNGQIALTKIQHTAYDAIICNLWMPVMDGLSFYQELIRISSHLATRVIFCTGVVIPETWRLLSETDRDVLLKPFRIEELYGVVKQVINASE